LLGDGRAEEAADFLEGLLHLFDGAVRRRTAACVLVARVFDAKWRQAPEYLERLRSCVQELRSLDWPAILINLPRLAAELCADALEQGLEPEFCRDFIRRRRLAAPDRRPGSWPWPLRVHLLREFRLERDGVPVDLGAKAPTRILDLVRVLAISKDQTRGLEDIYESLWPDADGDQAKAACEQALHRLRRLLGSPDFVSQREGKLRLSPELVWVDLDGWETDLRRASRLPPSQAADLELERVYWSFPGPLFQGAPERAWSLPAAERVRSDFIELASRIGKRQDSRGEHAKARTYYLRALDLYPTSERCYEALLRGRLAQDDVAGALEDYRRCESVLETTLDAGPSPAIRALMAPHLAGPTARRSV
jgi:DNA-binding SARP family transcriptional activator